MSSALKPHFTPEEYLALEREAEHKSEYFNGEIFAMAGASPQHNIITFNVAGRLHPQLTDRDCQGFVSDMKVKVSHTGLYTYPDVVVVCGELRFDDLDRDTLVNPTAIIEVLSPSTEAYDRGEKFAHYRTLDSLEEYVLISQDKPRVERFTRQPDGQWLLSISDGLEATVHLPSIGCKLPLAEVYDRVRFPVPDTDGPDGRGR